MVLHCTFTCCTTLYPHLTCCCTLLYHTLFYFFSVSRHYAVPTTDLPVHEVPLLLEWFKLKMQNLLVPLLRSQYFHRHLTHKGRVAILDAFVVKYTHIDNHQSCNTTCSPSSLDGSIDDISLSRFATIWKDHCNSKTTPSQRYLPLHQDQSTHSLTIALNSTGEYTGGGTYFADLDRAIRPDLGQILSFPGN